MTYNEKEGKKIALRFLKEAGLYAAWKEYVVNEAERNKNQGSIVNITVKNWSKRNFIDSIFGCTLFTEFLKNKYGFEMASNISNFFRVYVEEMYKNKFILRFSPRYNSFLRQAIEKETGNINIKILKNETFN